MFTAVLLIIYAVMVGAAARKKEEFGIVCESLFDGAINTIKSVYKAIIDRFDR